MDAPVLDENKFAFRCSFDWSWNNILHGTWFFFLLFLSPDGQYKFGKSMQLFPEKSMGYLCSKQSSDYKSLTFIMNISAASWNRK